MIDRLDLKAVRKVLTDHPKIGNIIEMLKQDQYREHQDGHHIDDDPLSLPDEFHCQFPPYHPKRYACHPTHQ